MPLMTFDEIKNGQYKVTVNLKNTEINITESILDRINEGAEGRIVTCKNNILKYKSETLLPPKENIDSNKKKLLFILGNPAIHSVEEKMFFFRDKNGNRHKFWGCLKDSCLLENFKLKTRKEEADKKRDLILTGNTNHRFVIGFTTFYSLPTPTGIKGNPYCDSKGVEKLFGLILKCIQEEEFERICNYPFAKDAILITRIDSAYNYLHKKLNNNKVKCWSIRGKGSGWEGLSAILNELK